MSDFLKKVIISFFCSHFCLTSLFAHQDSQVARDLEMRVFERLQNRLKNKSERNEVSKKDVFEFQRKEVESDFLERSIVEKENFGFVFKRLPIEEQVPKNKVGLFDIVIESNKIERNFLIYIPKGYRQEEALPVVLFFHGGGGSRYYQANPETYNLLSLAEEKKFIAIFPNGYSLFKDGKLGSWNAGDCCSMARDKKIQDVQFTKDILASVRNRLSVDERRIYASGMSNGAMMAYRLACEMSDTFAAIAAVAGTDVTKQCNPKHPVSILHIHAKNDTHVLFDGGAGKDAFKNKGAVTEFPSVYQTINSWRTKNGCSERYDTLWRNDKGYCERTEKCSQGVQVQLCVSTDGGHSWPGSSASMVNPEKEASSKSFLANEVIWSFFSVHKK